METKKGLPVWLIVFVIVFNTFIILPIFSSIYSYNYIPYYNQCCTHYNEVKHNPLINLGYTKSIECYFLMYLGFGLSLHITISPIIFLARLLSYIWSFVKYVFSKLWNPR